MNAFAGKNAKTLATATNDMLFFRPTAEYPLCFYGAIININLNRLSALEGE